MYLKHLVIKDFRNILSSTIDLDPHLNIFVGDNGQGKTNLLEATYFLLRGESFRPGDINQFIHNSSHHSSRNSTYNSALREENPTTEFSFLSAHAQKELLDFRLLCHLQDNKKKLFVNQKPITSNRLSEIFAVILFTPESLLLIKEGPEQRRDLVTELVYCYFPKSAHILESFQRALKTRNRVLRELQDAVMGREELLRTLKSLNPTFFKQAAAVTQLRLEALRAFMPVFQSVGQKLMARENVDISVDYVISGESAMGFSFDEVQNKLITRAAELRDAEIASGRSLFGPHKHDIKILLNGADSRYYCSQGQQRSLILAFKLALIEAYSSLHQQKPLLLLDDVLSELDLEKRWFLIRYLKSIETQILMTTTDLNLLEQFSDSLGVVFNVNNGRIQKAGSLNQEGVREREQRR